MNFEMAWKSTDRQTGQGFGITGTRVGGREMSCCIDYDEPEFYSETWHVARKDHVCCECGGAIQKGSRYQRIAGKWDGVISTHKTCELCADLRDSLAKVMCPLLCNLVPAYVDYLEDIGAYRYDEEADRYVYPENHLRLNR